jgi:Ser/Thr protein kinase RdoA (MazF antagonist)
MIGDLVAREREGLAADVLASLDRFVDGLPDRLAAVDTCGVPTAFVHGDFHPGNVRGDGAANQTILDWGDCGLGNPLLDLPAFLEVSPASHVNRIRDAWTGAWLRRVPSADPARAAALLAPVAAARQASIYATFLANIEPSERRYHEPDVPRWLKRTAQLVDREAAG